jgi:HlyD family secretion protein
VKTLQLQAAQAKLEGDRALSKEGLLSRDSLRQAELAAKQAEIELAQLTNERRNTEQSTALQAEGLSLQRASLEKEADEARRLLDLATTKADRKGVLTWIVTQEGALVRKGEVIARIADLTSFRVDASVSDVHAGRLHAGMPVVVKINDEALEGTIADVFPTIDNGVLRFTVGLRDRSHAQLRPSLRVDVLVITDRKPRALRVKRGPFADGAGTREAFVVRGDRAVKTRIEIGVFSFDEVEVVSGVSEGDEVIISDMRDYLHLKEVKVR